MQATPTTVSLSLDKSILERMLDFYKDDIVQNDNPHVYFQARAVDVTITVFNKEHQGLHKVVFQGKDAEHEASIWERFQKESPEAKPRKEPIRNVTPYFPQIGSDEVGTGDFFGPIVVVAAYVRKEDIPLLKELGVTDSKLLDDAKILQIGPVLAKAIDFEHLCLSNKGFNDFTKKGYNMNKIKAVMHNRCLFVLHKRHAEAKAYQDQFAESSLYFSYLKKESAVFRDITFATQGESKFPSVAAASVLARYSFLRHMQKLDEQYGVHFPLGAGPIVDRFAKRFLKEHGEEVFNEVAKTNFATMKKISR